MKAATACRLFLVLSATIHGSCPNHCDGYFLEAAAYQTTSSRAVVADKLFQCQNNAWPLGHDAGCASRTRLESILRVHTFLFVVLLQRPRLLSNTLCALLPHGLPPGRRIGFPAGLHPSTTTSSARPMVRILHQKARCRVGAENDVGAFLWTQLFYTKRLRFPTCLSSLR
jgi:hypothetical protein